MKDFRHEALSHDPVHGYIPFVNTAARESELTERQIIDHPWVQRLRQIHQLQTAWWVYPTAEHARFQHVLGTMHLASRAVDSLYESLAEVCPDVPSRGYVECLMRMAALLHDVGHGPFGHFFDAHFLADYGLTHETLGAAIIREDLGDLLRGIRRSPSGLLEAGEALDPAQIATLIARPQENDTDALPRWLVMLRSLFCGIYTVDNMDFVLRDAMMSGYSARAYDLDRLLHYSFFSEQGLTIHRRGLDALIRFMQVRSELFRVIYFHRTVRAIDLTLADLFADSKSHLFTGNPLENRDAYRRLTEWSLLVDVATWHTSDNAERRGLADRWQRFLNRDLQWRSAVERNLVFPAGSAESTSIFSRAEMVERAVREQLGSDMVDLPMRVDLPRHIYRPHAQAATAGQNFLSREATGEIGPLTDDQLFRQLPLSGRICRIYVSPDTSDETKGRVAVALDALLNAAAVDDVTNM